MRQMNVYEAKAKLSELIESALKGEEIIIAKDNKPMVRLEPLPEAKGQRTLGRGKSYILKISDDFDQPLDDFKDYIP